VFLAATSLLVPAFRRFGLSSVMAFLVIGLLLGPHVLGNLAGVAPWLKDIAYDPERPAAWLAELGVVLLLFMIGLEVSLERLWSLRRYVLGLGIAQVVVTSVAIGAIALGLGVSLPVASVAGLALALSSTAVVLQLLAERRQLASTTGRASFSVLLLQDVAVVPILFVVAAMGQGKNAGPADLPLALGAAALTILAVLVVGRFLLRPLLRWAAGVGSREVFVAATLLVVLATASIASVAGLSMALGAFLAGLLIAETEFRHEVETDIEPFKGLFLGMFFVTVGMQIELELLAQQGIPLMACVVGLFILKAALIIGLARLFGLRWPQAIESGFLLSQAGEFAFVIITLAQRGGIFPEALADQMLLVVALSIFLSPLVASLGARAARWAGAHDASSSETEFQDAEGHVVIAGYGRVGQALGEVLQKQEVPHAAIDAHADSVGRLRKLGWPVHFGDARRKEVLERVGAGRAAAIVVTMDAPEAVERLVRVVRETWPDVPVFARARDPQQARRFHDAGATYAMPDTVEASLQLGEALLNSLGFPEEAARRVINERREIERARALRSVE
jgi:monovalent cation:proton antiporter-2 (CPA2) family protein